MSVAKDLMRVYYEINTVDKEVLLFLWHTVLENNNWNVDSIILLLCLILGKAVPGHKNSEDVDKFLGPSYNP